jgi:hypothetical protein
LKGGNAGGDLAHLGGALIGYVFITQLKSGNDWGIWLNNLLSWIDNFGKKNKKNKQNVPDYSYSNKSNKKTNSQNLSVKYTGGGKTEKDNNFPNQDEIDKILDKISDTGYESLSKEEKEKLFKASNQNN